MRFSLFGITVGVITARKDEVGGAETHKVDILGPRTSSAASSLLSVSADQDINDEAQSVFSQAEGVTSNWPSGRIQRRLFLFCYRVRIWGKRRP